MPPSSIPTGQSRITNSNGYSQLPKVFLLVLLVATAIRLVVLHCIARKRRIASSCQPVQDEKEPLFQPLQESKDSKPCQAPPSEEDLRQDLSPQSKDQPPPTFRPIYPWIAAPQPLPGPYDPRFYPLPTIRRHSYDPTHSPASESEDESILYTRRVSTNSLPIRQSTLHGTVTTSNGTRRNHWVVSGG